MFNVQKRTTTQAAKLRWVKIQLCGKSFARKRERYVRHNRLSGRAGFFLQSNINSNDVTNNCLALVQMQLTAVQCMRARRLRECSRQWDNSLRRNMKLVDSISPDSWLFSIALHCVLLHLLSCIVLFCCTVHYCLFSFLIFSLPELQVQ